MDTENRLQIRQVTTLFNQQSISVISDGVSPGEPVVLSDLVPATPDMLLEPVHDPETERQLLADARSE